ncbi:MAG: encapsulin-associated ferritin-like protein [Phycisphaerae bacterium]
MPLEQHEPREVLPAEVTEQHRAIASMIEEFEAVAWYHQRAAATADEQLRKVVEHNRDEEIEHAMMLLEWLRRNFPGFDENMRTYLFTSAPIEQVEELAEQGDGGEGEGSPPSDGSLRIGSLKKQEGA